MKWGLKNKKKKQLTTIKVGAIISMLCETANKVEYPLSPQRKGDSG